MSLPAAFKNILIFSEFIFYIPAPDQISNFSTIDDLTCQVTNPGRAVSERQEACREEGRFDLDAQGRYPAYKGRRGIDVILEVWTGDSGAMGGAQVKAGSAVRLVSGGG